MAEPGKIIKENLPLIKKELNHFSQKEGILNHLSNNRILFVMLKLKHINGKFSHLLKLGDKQMEKLKKTLVFLNKKIHPRCLVLVARTNKFIPYVTTDVDLLVKEKDFDKLKKLLRNFNWHFSSHDHSLGGRIPGAQINAQKKDFLNLDIHQDFTWQRSTYIDKKVSWEKIQSVKIAGVSCQTPSLEVEFLLNSADIIFEKFYLTLLDFLYLKTVLGKRDLDWSLIKEQTKKFGWNRAFDQLIRMTKKIDKDLAFADKPIFPYLFSQRSVFSSFWEKYQERRSFDLVCFLYYWYCLSRYLLGGKKTLAYYCHWFKLDK